LEYLYRMQRSIGCSTILVSTVLVPIMHVPTPPHPPPTCRHRTSRRYSSPP
jgi:hypothetical protein